MACGSNPFWVRLDKKLISQVVKLDKNNPVEVESFYRHRTRDTTKQNLGFGWHMWETRIGGGYISIAACFYYFNDTIASYSLSPQMPDEGNLVVKYSEWYAPSFKVDSNRVTPFEYNMKRIISPLDKYAGDLAPDSVPMNIREYMSPSSGIMYGYRGGYGMSLLQNRAEFMSLNEKLTTDQVVIMMYSINPASRFTAIEYYITNKSQFTDTLKIDQWINICFAELPEVTTLMGCFVTKMDSRSLVYLLVGIKPY